MDTLTEWRKSQRQQLIAAREAIPADIHRQWSRAITDWLKAGFPQLQGITLGVYWPFRGEYNPQQIAEHFRDLGAILALPEVINKDKPLCFREWLPDSPMKNGAYGIPVPMETKPVMLDAVLIPMVGFDQHGYRLGYGSGYFDRTLASYHPQPLAIGIAFEMQRLENVYPQPHDIAMQYIVTEAGIFQPANHELTATSIIQNPNP